MSERMKAEITIGGDVVSIDVAGLIGQINQSGVSLEWSGQSVDLDEDPASAVAGLLNALEGDHLVLRDDEAPYGKFPSLEIWLRDHRVPYDRHSSAKYEYDPQIVYYRPDSGLQSFLATDEGAPLAYVSDVIAAVYQNGVARSLDDILNGLAALTDHPDDLPPFRIVQPPASPPAAASGPANAYPWLLPGERLVEVAWMEGIAGLNDAEAGVWRFAVGRDAYSVNLLLRDAIRAYLAKPGANPGRAAFNWDDAINELAAEDWAKFGLRLIADPIPSAKIVVDHNETFSARK